MSKYQEDKKRYIVSRKVDDIEAIANIDDYSGNIYWTESIENASKFDTIEEAKKFIGLQKDLSKLLKKDYEYKVLEEHRVIKEV